MTTFILVGGLGTRLRSVIGADTPKPLADIGGQPFLKRLLHMLFRQGIRDVVLGTGHLAAEFEAKVAEFRPEGMSVRFSFEAVPLGTGGAISNARSMLDGERVLVLNGDSVAGVDVNQLLNFHLAQQAGATLALVTVPDASRFGTVTVDDDHNIQTFKEKTGVEAPGLINAGIYILSKSFLDTLPKNAFSLERDIFPERIGYGLKGLAFDGEFIDIGTPESYAEAADFFERFSS